MSGYADFEEVMAANSRVALLLCPEPDHSGPFEVPWSLAARTEPEEEYPAGTGESVVAAICATPERAERTAESIGALLGRPARLVEADHEELLEQYRVERDLTD
ncbi:hypothetical protein ACWFMI_12425 [Nocardiopsis terrae]